MIEVDSPMLSAVTAVVGHLASGHKKATKYLSPRTVVKGTRRFGRGSSRRRIEMVITVGAPNYAERQFIKTARKAGVPFPVRRVVVRK